MSAQDLEQLFATASPRLLWSISRRLGYLHTSETAQKIVRRWLADDGLLGHLETLDEDRMAMLANVAPVDPVTTLREVPSLMVWSREIRTRPCPATKLTHSPAFIHAGFSIGATIIFGPLSKQSYLLLPVAA